MVESREKTELAQERNWFKREIIKAEYRNVHIGVGADGVTYSLSNDNDLSRYRELLAPVLKTLVLEKP